MKALIFRETGEPKSVLKLAEIPTPPLAPGEALVRVLLSPINPSDLHMVRGRYGYQPELPASPESITGISVFRNLLQSLAKAGSCFSAQMHSTPLIMRNGQALTLLTTVRST